jgi:glycosyltransferase involved in cell wall biosynthesis
VRWLRVRDHFDVVHVHCMPVRFLGPTPPVVATDSAGTFWYWTAARGIPEARVDRLLRRERRLARAFGYLHPTANPEAAHSLLLFVASGRELLARVGVDPGWIKLCPVGVPPPLAQVERPGRSGSSILFVARDFALKGGATAVDVLRRVRRVLPDARLLVAGSAEPDPGIDGVEWIGPTTREELYRSVYPRADVLLYPTTFDTASLVVTEALAHGVPVVAPAAFCLPDLVLDGRTGVLYPPDDVAAATDAVLALLTDPRRLARMRRHAVEDYGSRLSPEVRNDVLLAAYRRAAGRAGPNRR